jgi:hypothetical protein
MNNISQYLFLYNNLSSFHIMYYSFLAKVKRKLKLKVKIKITFNNSFRQRTVIKGLFNNDSESKIVIK